MRLFIAVDFEELSGYFRELQEKIPKARATYPRKFHVTLRFLGEVPDNKVEEIKKSLSAVSSGQFTLRTGNLGFFPDEKFIRVVWLGFEDSDKMSGLQENINKALEGIFSPDKRFMPHITLARIKYIEKEKKKEFVDAVKSIEPEEKTANVSSFKLIKSTLTKEGPVYEDLAVFELNSKFLQQSL